MVTELGEPVDGSTDTGGLRITGLSKTFPGVQALRDVSLSVRPGSVHALLGHNGCGKSTLVKVLAGYHAPDPGAHAELDGTELELGSAEAAGRADIRFVHQELGLIAELDAVDNVGLALGYERGPLGAIGWRKQARITEELLARFGISVDTRLPIGQASPVERTAVAIVRAVAGWHRGRGLLVLDEPTAALPAREVDELFRLIRDIRDSGTAVLLISHRLDEVVSIADHATVMRAGEVIWDGAVADMSVRSFATLIAGVETEVIDTAHRRPRAPGAGNGVPALEVEGLTGRYLRDVSLQVGVGEIVGIAGLLGSGREELPYLVAGAQSKGVTGTIRVAGEALDNISIASARARGIALVPADRGKEGIVADFSVKENVSIASLPALRTGRTLSRRRERRFARTWLEAVSADTSVIDRLVTTLSGGNQQKAILARWLSVSPKVLTLSEPTAGIDIGARTTIYQELRSRADDGLAVLMSSSDAEDLVAVCDRVIVLRDGVIAAELQATAISKTAIVAAMEGVHGDQQD